MESRIDGILAMIKALTPCQRRALISRVLRAGILTDDEEDALLLEQRKGEPTTPAEEFFDHRKA
jgi:hypothetical protein